MKATYSSRIYLYNKFRRNIYILQFLYKVKANPMNFDQKYKTIGSEEFNNNDNVIETRVWRTYVACKIFNFLQKPIVPKFIYL